MEILITLPAQFLVELCCVKVGEIIRFSKATLITVLWKLHDLFCARFRIEFEMLEISYVGSEIILRNTDET